MIVAKYICPVHKNSPKDKKKPKVKLTNKKSFVFVILEIGLRSQSTYAGYGVGRVQMGI